MIISLYKERFQNLLIPIIFDVKNVTWNRLIYTHFQNSAYRIFGELKLWYNLPIRNFLLGILENKGSKLGVQKG